MFNVKNTLIATGLAVLSLSAIIIAQGQEESAFGFLRSEDYQASGLNKLDPHEQAHLRDLLVHAPLPSYCEQSAAAYMKEQGWRTVRVVGGYREADWPNELRLFLQEDYRTLVLKPTITPDVLEPGVYWGKSVGSQWTLLYPDGRQGSFSVVDRH